MGKNKVYWIFGFIVAILVSGCIDQEAATKNRNQSIRQDTDVSNGLGTLCSGEKECTDFCLNNRGRCEAYCKGNINNLCKIIFPPPSQVSEGTPEISSERECTSNTKTVFAATFTDLTKIRHITPIGNVKAGSLSRSYISVKEYENGTRMFVPLYSPTNATLFRIAYAYRGDPAQGGRPEYRLDFRVSCEVIFGFDHIANISDRVKQFAPTVPTYMTRGGKDVSVPITEGEFLGSTNGGLVGGAWDFLLFNYAKEVYHINPFRWTSEHNKYADCPYDYFTEDLRKQYYAMFASAGGEKAPSTCRSASRDVAGSLSGGWFQGNATDTSGSRIVVGSDFSTVDLVVDKDDPRAAGSVLSIRHQNAPIKPEGVKVGDSVCYSDGTNHAFLKLLNETQMASDIGPGGCPSQLPPAYETWNR